MHDVVTCRRRTTSGLSALGLVTLVSVVAVLVLVSLPRLRGFALHENEQDAVQITRLLAQGLDGLQDYAPSPRIEVLADEVGLRATLVDADFLAEGHVLRRHGYLFEVVDAGSELALPGAVHAAERRARLLVRAWPWDEGRTGRRSFIGVPGGVVYQLEAAGSGPLAPPAPPWRASEWTEVR